MEKGEWPFRGRDVSGLKFQFFQFFQFFQLKIMV